MPILKAFVARSFSAEDNRKVDPILNFLSSLQPIGLVWQTAEAAEVERVSEKVRRLIDESEIFVGILTARHPVFKIGRGWKEAYKILRGTLAPVVHTAPPWILQELGYALKGDRKPILFLEPGVEVPGLQGDLEYIEYDWNNTGKAFQRANEMLLGLVGKQAGMAVETVLRVAATSERQEAAQPEETHVEEPPGEQPSAATCYFEMMEAFEARHLAKATDAFERGVKLAEQEKPELVVMLKALYERKRFSVGDSEGLENLRRLQEANTTNYVIAGYIGACLSDFGEYDQAAIEFKRAASLASGEAKVRHTVKAADCLKRAKKHEDAVQFLLQSLNEDGQNRNADTLQALYGVMMDAERDYEAFGIAELLLRENPGQADFRFDVGLKYRRWNLNDLFLYHFKLISESDPHNRSALHNLALAHSDFGLHILSASHYKRALELGETLSASNLGHMYLDCGMADEAEELLKRALKVENCVPEVPECLAAVGRAREGQAEQETAVVEGTRRHRDFLVSLGEGFLSVDVPPLDGTWKFPDVEIPLAFSALKLTGQCQRTTQVPTVPLSSLLGGLGGLGRHREHSTREECFRFSGAVTGRVCRFEIQKSETTGAKFISPLLGPSASTIKGYIVFSSNGLLGDVAELKDDKPDKYYAISKISR